MPYLKVMFAFIAIQNYLINIIPRTGFPLNLNEFFETFDRIKKQSYF